MSKPRTFEETMEYINSIEILVDKQAKRHSDKISDLERQMQIALKKLDRLRTYWFRVGFIAGLAISAIINFIIWLI
jgi:hypothetical protein